MPTIDQLPPAPAASDADEFPASQAGTVRRVTRAQILAGTQQQLAVLPGKLLGRISNGIGVPETIGIGSGLFLNSGALCATPPIQPLLLGQDASLALVTPTGALVPHSIADLFAASVSPESFGAVGDGVTDDTAAIRAAIATLRPVRFAARVYSTTGQWTIPNTATLLGDPGQTVIRRIGQIGGGAWISIQGAVFSAYGIIFDANKGQINQESWALLVTTSCTTSHFHQCTFCNAQGPTLGNGLTIQASDPTISNHIIDDCEANGNEAHGIWLQAIDGARISHTRAHDNEGYGLCADFNDALFLRQIRLCAILGNRCWNNARGISIGNFNSTNGQPPVWGNANPDAIGFAVHGNICHDNLVYGIAVSGSALNVNGNLLSNNGSSSNGGAGILANCSYSRVASNTITGSSQYGIDAGGSVALDIASNHITKAAVGINPGGSTSVRINGNYLSGNGWGITVYNVETDGLGNNFGLATSNMTITDNTISIVDGAGGIWLIDAPQAIMVTGNIFLGLGTASIGQCLFNHTDSVIVESNHWNNTARFVANPGVINSLQTVQIPDIADEVMLSIVPTGGVQSIMTQHQVATLGQIGFVKVINSGSGYTHASVMISGAGTGAAASPFISAGRIIGVSLDAPGSGYGPIGASASVIITGDGNNAAATASVGLPVIEGRRIRLICNTAVRFSRVGSNPFQENWTLADVTVPANATIAFTGTFGTWRADGVPLADYIAPSGDGGIAIRTMGAGNLTLWPSSSGHVRMATDVDPAGYLMTIGHGSPVGVVVAPPGSDYRNLDGGVAQTLWIKRTGLDASGWFAIA